jgi:sirohydrochlorin ferrochelatase
MTSPPLVAVAHGSRDPFASASTSALMDEVRRQRPGLNVACAYLEHGRPRPAEALAAVGAGAVVVPLLLTEAFHTRTDLPAQLAVAEVGAVQSDALGPHPLLLVGLERRLGEVGVPPGDPGTAVVLAAAGSAHVAAQRTIREQAHVWGARGWWAVEPAYASAGEPTVEAAVRWLRRRGAPRVAVASYLLAPGLFADRLLASGADVVSAPLGDAPEVAAVVLQRYDAAVLSRRGSATLVSSAAAQ